jgi:YhcN/YlaJ family sporulation lipoprotein
MRLTRLLRLMVVLVLVMSILPGCQSPQKPLLPQSDTSNKTKLSQLSPSERRILTSRLSNHAAQVEGVERAIVVLASDNNDELVALVGLVLNNNAAQAQSIKQAVIAKVKGADQRVTQVLATTDPNMVKRISDIAAGIIEGKPIKSYARDVNELNRMLQKQE